MALNIINLQSTFGAGDVGKTAGETDRLNTPSALSKAPAVISAISPKNMIKCKNNSH